MLGRVAERAVVLLVLTLDCVIELSKLVSAVEAGCELYELESAVLSSDSLVRRAGVLELEEGMGRGGTGATGFSTIFAKVSSMFLCSANALAGSRPVE